MRTIMECNVCNQTCKPNEAWAFYLNSDRTTERAMHHACARDALMRDTSISGAMFRKWNVDPIGVEKPAIVGKN